MTILDPRVWLAFLVALAITAGGGYFKGHADGTRAAAVGAQKAQLVAVAAARAEEQRRTAAQSENAKDANKQRTAALADAFAARAAAGSLQQRVDQLVAAARHPAASTGSPAAGDALDLLADVFGRADERAGELAAYADAARIAGRQCERDYDALTVSDEKKE
ncbi:gp23 [Burkholderia phage BcepC6B]|uniref:Gp23 n=1 Tax=Burkholderia phage BcepC6B TaxID=2883949 RepID=Q6J1Q4_9CAUD|nr:Rz-like spanin [Burkholderia phage BcepC6B]AAT38382.1 gp23 [Burkholderia phage BcepC6B]